MSEPKIHDDELNNLCTSIYPDFFNKSEEERYSLLRMARKWADACTDLLLPKIDK